MMHCYFGAGLLLTSASAFSQFDSGLMVEIGKNVPTASIEKKISALPQDGQKTEQTTVSETNHYAYGYLAQAQIWLAAVDPRKGFGFSYGVGRKDPRLHWGRDGELIWEGYFLESTGNQVFEYPASTTQAWGVLATARYRIKMNQRDNFFYDIGFGVQWVNKTSHDLRLANNTTPTLGIGIESRMADNKSWIWGLRVVHASNAGRTKTNPGQNMLEFMIGIKY
jgi:hypothetical protein